MLILVSHFIVFVIFIHFVTDLYSFNCFLF